jgi:uncharacterized RmlC-like cupin family protein
LQAAHSSAHIGGVRVIAGNNLDPKAAQTPGMDRKAAINFARVGAEKLWAGTVTIHPDAKTGAHHHGHLERVIHVVKGAQRREAVAINLDIEPLEKPEAVHWVDPIHLAPD